MAEDESKPTATSVGKAFVYASGASLLGTLTMYALAENHLDDLQQGRYNSRAEYDRLSSAYAKERVAAYTLLGTTLACFVVGDTLIIIDNLELTMSPGNTTPLLGLRGNF